MILHTFEVKQGTHGSAVPPGDPRSTPPEAMLIPLLKAATRLQTELRALFATVQGLPLLEEMWPLQDV